MTEIATRTRAMVYRIEDLVTLARQGRLRVPEFQRNFRWDRGDVLNLFDSIVKGYPVGSLLLWERPAEQRELILGDLVISAPQVTDALWVVDGQQRITAIANAVSPDSYADSERFRLDFDLSRKAFVPAGGRPDLRVPLPVLFDLRQLLQWAQAHPDSHEHISALNDIAVRLRDFSVPASIVAESDEKTLREIFDRTNNAGKKLKRAEVFHALFGDGGDQGLTIEAIAEELEATSFGRIDDDTVLHAILARRHHDFTRDLRQEFTEERGAILDVPRGETQEQAFQGGRQALRRAITFLQDRAGVPHVTFLPYKYLLTTLARFFAHHPAPHPRNEELMVRWFWRAALAPTIFSGSATAMGRGFASRIYPADESRSVQELLALVPDGFPYHRPEVDQFRTNTAATKVMLCALYQARPLRFSDGAPFDAAVLAETLDEAQTAHGVIADAVPRRRITDSALAAGIGGRFFLGEDDVSLEEARHALAGATSALFGQDDARIAASHLVDAESSEVLRSGEYELFLRRRRDRIEALVADFLASRMGLGLPANPPLGTLDLDDPEPDEWDESDLR